MRSSETDIHKETSDRSKGRLQNSSRYFKSDAPISRVPPKALDLLWTGIWVRISAQQPIVQAENLLQFLHSNFLMMDYLEIISSGSLEITARRFFRLRQGARTIACGQKTKRGRPASRLCVFLKLILIGQHITKFTQGLGLIRVF